MASGFITLPLTGGGGGGIASINGDTTAAQVIAAGSGIAVSSSGGTTTISSSGGGSGANTALSNIASVAASADMNPGADDAYDMGSPTERWKTAYLTEGVWVGQPPPYGSGVGNGIALDPANVALQAIFYGSNSGTLALLANATWEFSAGGTEIFQGSPGGTFICINGQAQYQFNASDVRLFFADLNIFSPGKGLGIKSGTNQRAGTDTLASGTVSVANTGVTTSTIILVTPQSTGVGTVSATPNPGTGFTMDSTDITDARTVAYFLVEII